MVAQEFLSKMASSVIVRADVDRRDSWLTRSEVRCYAGLGANPAEDGFVSVVCGDKDRSQYQIAVQAHRSIAGTSLSVGARAAAELHSWRGPWTASDAVVYTVTAPGGKRSLQPPNAMMLLRLVRAQGAISAVIQNPAAFGVDSEGTFSNVVERLAGLIRAQVRAIQAVYSDG